MAITGCSLGRCSFRIDITNYYQFYGNKQSTFRTYNKRRMTDECLLTNTVSGRHKSSALLNKGSPFELSKSIILKDSVLKRLDINRSDFSEERVKSSQLYQQLQRRIDITKERQESELEDLDEMIRFAEQRIASEKKVIHHHKVQMWELKNTLMELQQLLLQEEDLPEACRPQEQEEEEEDSQKVNGANEEQDQGSNSSPFASQSRSEGLLEGWEQEGSP